MKRCKKCGVEKQDEEFSVRKFHSSGRNTICKQCKRDEYRLALETSGPSKTMCICSHCGKEFYVHTNKIAKGHKYKTNVGRFCSRSCLLSYQHNHNALFAPQPSTLDHAGYVCVRLGRYSKRVEHRIVAERALGRPLKKNEVVHHINMDKTDNRPCNLIICDQKYHAWLHSEMARRYAVEHFA